MAFTETFLFFAVSGSFLSVNNRATAFLFSSTGAVSDHRRHQLFRFHYSSPWNNQDNLSSSDNGGADTSQPSSTPSGVGEYVQGVHGGKYQFEDPGGSTFAGRQFAEALYSSDPSEGVIVDGNEHMLFGENKAFPSWLEKMGTAAKLGTLTPYQNFPILALSPASPTTSISITNDERSWEHFYCKIIQVAPDGSVVDGASILCHNQRQQQQQQQQQQQENCALGGAVLYHVAPATGHLAPRGGSSNLCDPDKPYSDTATILITASAGTVERTIARADSASLLVVGTEAETWNYWLQYDI